MLIAQKKRIKIMQQLTNHDTLHKIMQSVMVFTNQGYSWHSGERVK